MSRSLVLFVLSYPLSLSVSGCVVAVVQQQQAAVDILSAVLARENSALMKVIEPSKH